MPLEDGVEALTIEPDIGDSCFWVE